MWAHPCCGSAVAVLPSPISSPAAGQASWGGGTELIPALIAPTGSPVPAGPYLGGGDEYLLLLEAVAAQLGFEFLQLLLGHLGRPCCRKGGVKAGKRGK